MAEDKLNRPPLVLYNTMTKKKEVFKSKVPNKVGMYICGVTAYDFSHIGHARAYVAFDVLYRFFAEFFTFSIFQLINSLLFMLFFMCFPNYIIRD